MTIQKLEIIAQELVGKGRGILAADESTSTIGHRFQSIGIENSEQNRRAYRDMLFRSKQFGRNISGVILYDETIRQKAVGGRTLMRELIQRSKSIAGIKVDMGAKPLAGYAGETITEGLDGLRERLAEYAEMGAGFAKWRAVIDINTHLPTPYAVRSNMQALARYAALCQEVGIVPIVEPEILMDGDHTIERCFEVTRFTLNTLYQELSDANIHLEGTLLKPNMVISGMKSSKRAGREQVAEATVRCLKQTVPSAVPGIVFLSGGQGDVEATEHLNIMNAQYDLPWALSFSYGRALQAACLKTWGGKVENVEKAQDAFLHRARMNGLAAQGKWRAELEQELAAKMAA